VVIAQAPKEPVWVYRAALPKTDLPSVEAEPTRLGRISRGIPSHAPEYAAQ
jgi:hypothetical protein